MCWQNVNANVRFRAARIVLLVLFYNGAFTVIDSFRFRPVHYPLRWAKVIRGPFSFCFFKIISLIVSGRYPENPDLFRERAVFSYLLTTVTATAGNSAGEIVMFG